jgi:hypothetical protein
VNATGRHGGIIAADVRRFGRLINKDGVLGTHSFRFSNSLSRVPLSVLPVHERFVGPCDHGMAVLPSQLFLLTSFILPFSG